MRNFYTLFADTLEMPAGQIDPAAEIRTLEKWDSIAALGVLAMVEEHFGVRLTSDDFASVTTVGDLENLVLRRAER
jgi:acyl carrier protein